MPTAGSEILQYQGSADLGLGSNAAIPAIYSDNSVIDQMNRDLMQLDHQDKVIKWQQKIKDRDTELAAIDAGQIQTGEILEKDRPAIDAMQKEADKAFFDMVAAGGINNKEAYRKYASKVKELKDGVTYAQHNFLGRTKMAVEAADQVLEDDKKRYSDALAAEDKKGLYDSKYIGPEKAFSINTDALFEEGVDGILTEQSTAPTKQKTTKATTKGAAPAGLPTDAVEDVTTETIKAPNGKTYQVTKSELDLNKMYQNHLRGFNTPASNENQTKIRQKYETLPPEFYEPAMQQILRNAERYNREKGLQPSGIPNYQGLTVDPVSGAIDTKVLAQKLGLDPNTGKQIKGGIMLSTPEFSTFLNLGRYNAPFKKQSANWKQEEDEFDLKKQAEANKIVAEKIKAGAKVAAARMSKEGKIRVQELKNARGQSGDETGLHNVFDDAVGMSTPNEDGTYTVKASDLPEGYQTFLGGLKVNSETGKTTVAELKPRPDGTYKISNGAFMNGTLLTDFQINEAKDAYNKKNGTNLSGAKFLFEMSKKNKVKLAPAYLVGDKGQTVDLNQILDAQKIVIQPTVKKSEQVPTEITIENNTVETE